MQTSDKIPAELNAEREDAPPTPAPQAVADFDPLDTGLHKVNATLMAAVDGVWRQLNADGIDYEAYLEGANSLTKLSREIEKLSRLLTRSDFPSEWLQRRSPK